MHRRGLEHGRDANIHLTSDPYGPYLVRDGAPLDKMLALERRLRLPEVSEQVRELPDLTAAGIRCS